MIKNIEQDPAICAAGAEKKTEWRESSAIAQPKLCSYSKAVYINSCSVRSHSCHLC